MEARIIREGELAGGTTGTQPPMTATTIRDQDRRELLVLNKKSRYVKLSKAVSAERRCP
jgi:hypothetical protein